MNPSKGFTFGTAYGFLHLYNDIYKTNIKTIDGKPIVRKTWMFYHKDSLKLNIVKAFVDFIEKEYKGASHHPFSPHHARDEH